MAKHLTHYFPSLVSYNRMVEVKRQSFIPLAIYLKTFASADCTGVYFVDSSPLRVCHKTRIHQHKTFKNIAQRGYGSTGWFYGFKLHLLTNDQGGIIDFMLTPGNIDDRKPLRFNSFIKKLFGKLLGNKVYIQVLIFRFVC